MARELAGGRVRFLGSWMERPPDFGLPEVLFAGRSNVGKSSCINVLVGVNNAARVSKEPGRTRAINLFELPRHYILVDLPGYGYARVSREMHKSWEQLVESYLTDRPALRAAVVLLDPRRELEPLDEMLLQGLHDLGIPRVLVATKIDKLSRNEQRTALARLRQDLSLGDEPLIPFSSLNRTGYEPLRDAIETRIRTPERQVQIPDAGQ